MNNKYLNEFEIENFKRKTQQWINNDFLVEKEIETEFYTLMERYYFNKYTVKGKGIIDYSANHNIDGLLQVRTLDYDYRILVEAKSFKDYTNERSRNEVLTQAISYIKKLYAIGEQVPSTIILISLKCIVVFNSEQFENLFKSEILSKNAIPPSSATNFDFKLIQALSELRYSYNIFTYTDDLNNMFEHIDTIGNTSKYSHIKMKKYTDNSIGVEKILESFLDKNNIFYQPQMDKIFYFDGINRWIEISDIRLEHIIRQFIYQSRVNSSNINITHLIDMIKSVTMYEKKENISFNNGILNIPTGEFHTTINKTQKTFIHVDSCFENTTIFVNDHYSLSILFNSFFFPEKSCKTIIVKSEHNYFNNLRLFFEKNNNFVEYNRSNISNDRIKFLLIHNGDKANINRKILDEPFRLIEINSVKSTESLLNELVSFGISYNLFNLDSNIENNVPESIINTVTEWNENNDMLLNWFNHNIETGSQHAYSYITFDDLWKSYNETITSRGNSPVSMRIFVEQFLNHSVYHDNTIDYRKGARIGVKFNRSVFYPANDPTYMPKPDPKVASHITGAAFKKKEE